VSLERQGDVLVVKVVERPAIAEINFTGNKDIETKELKKSLKDVGFAEGQASIARCSTRSNRNCNASISARASTPSRSRPRSRRLERNRVSIAIDVSEGKVARIKRINLVGNHAFKDDELLDTFQLTGPRMFSFFSSSDQYSSRKLSADLETLRSYYQDRGYINFNIDSTQVAISPDKKDIYITINITRVTCTPSRK